MRQPTAGGVPGNSKNWRRNELLGTEVALWTCSLPSERGNQRATPPSAVPANLNPSARTQGTKFISKQVSHATRSGYVLRELGSQFFWQAPVSQNQPERSLLASPARHSAETPSGTPYKQIAELVGGLAEEEAEAAETQS
jgi:hypothetical protein